MAFGNAKQIVQRTSGSSAIKLLLLTAKFSRPGLLPLWKALLSPFVHSGEISVPYKEAGKSRRALLRTSDESSDLHSVLEVIVRKVYPLDPAFAAELVIDGGANIGLFSLQASAVYPAAKIVMCEPLPRNIEHLERQMKANQVSAKLMPVCIGGAHRTIPFYCRGANASSFDPHAPYTSVMEIDVLRLGEIIGDSPAKRILIKLDIEGMEIESLQEYVPGENRAVIIFGELHGHKENSPVMARLFAEHGWLFRIGDLSGEDTIFEARSPAAVALGLRNDPNLHIPA